MSVASLSVCTADKLCKLLGMLGSDQPLERASYALKIDQLVRASNLTWWQILGPSPGPAPAVGVGEVVGADDLIAAALAFKYALNDWELDFVESMRRRRDPLTERQHAKLKQIVDQLPRRAAA